MTTVRRHPARRYHVPNRGRTFPNRPNAKNRKRLKKGLRKIHHHSNAGVVHLLSRSPEEFTKSEMSKVAKNVCGWLNTMVSNLTRRLASDGMSGSAELSQLQRAKHRMEYMLADMLNVDSGLAPGKRTESVRKCVLPTFSNVYSREGVRDGRYSVQKMLNDLCEVNERFQDVLDLI